jgi:glycosyltransferase involved in cell wall biosynthesis
MHSLDLVIPLYNSSAITPQLIQRLNEWCASIDFEVKVIFVDDGSSRSSWEIIRKAEKNFAHRYIGLAKNYGQHTATAMGLSYCEAPLVATMDDDLQHDPFELNKMMEKMEQSKADLVFGTFQEKQHSFLRNLGSGLLKWIFSHEKLDYSSITSFRLMKKHVARPFIKINKPIVFIEEYLLRSATKKVSCPIRHGKRESNSSYSYRNLFRFALKIVLYHSSFPLKFIIRLGLLTAVACFFMACYFIYKKWAYGAYVGFSALIVSIFFSTGILMVTLGIIGEYIRRIWINQHELDRIMVLEESHD